MPPKGKAKNAPNQHDKRHESGLAPPGKRVVKQRSNTQLNGSPNGKSISPPALPSTGLNQGFKFPRPADNAAATTTASPATVAATAAPVAPTITVAAARDHGAAVSGRERDRTASDASGEDVGSYGDAAAHHISDTPSVLAGAEGQTMASFKGRPPANATPLSTVSTILTYYPLRDAISILILLLSLPPTLVLVIQTLFASLTFVPPTAGLSLSTLPNIKEMFNSTNIGYPAMATILIVDLVFWVCWLPVWKPVQNIFLDLSQAVIAVSLSGAAAGTGGPTYSIATCTFIVCVVHVLRYRAIHLTALDYLRSVIHKMDVGFNLDAPSFAVFFSANSNPPVDRGWAFTVFRTMLGIHIVSQGVTTCIRRSLVQANERDQNLPVGTKTDTDAAPGVEPTSRANGGLSDASPLTHPAAPAESRPSGLAPAHRDNKSRESSKKKRKQANQVRSQQPLWAAIASTKVTFVKEMEQRDAADDAREANLMNNNNNKPTTFANTNYNADRIWICDVRDTEIGFYVELSSESTVERPDGTEDGFHPGTGIDKSKPFYVRINGAAWSSTHIRTNSAGEEAHKSPCEHYVVKIFGLAPLVSYHCEIVGMTSQNVLCSVGLVTQPAPTAEQAASAPVHVQHPALRPSSPITTLKQSIQSAEAKLNEVRNRTKKTRRDQRAAYTDVKKEINQLKGKLESSGGIDEKMERRHLQLNQHKNQAEEATAELRVQIEALGEIPEDELAASEARRQVWQRALDAKNSASREFEDAKAEYERELGILKNDIGASETKKEKLTTRNAQRAQELERLMVKQQADMTARQRRDFERAQVQQERERREAELRFHINNMESEAQGLTQRAHDAWQQMSNMSSWGTQPPVAYPSFPSPPTSESILSGPGGAITSSSNGFAVSGFKSQQPYNPPFHATQSPANEFSPSANSTVGVSRGRSSSMLSQYSGFTDNGDDFNYGPPEPRQQNSWPMQGANHLPRAFDDGRGSDGDGSGSGSGHASLTNGSTNGSNSPRPEARPFIPTVGTIGPPGKMPQ